jgi:hypothetical protein
MPTESPRSAATASPSWVIWSEIPRVCLHKPFLRRTLMTAVLVGTALFGINQLDVVLAGAASPRVWCKVALTYLVPFLVSNYGLLIATRRPRSVVSDTAG